MSRLRYRSSAVSSVRRRARCAEQDPHAMSPSGRVTAYRSHHDGDRSAPRHPLGADPRARASVALQPFLGSGRAVGEHRRFARGAQPRRRPYLGARARPACTSAGAAPRPARRRRVDGACLGATLAAAEPRGRPRTAGHRPRQGDRPAPAGSPSHEAQQGRDGAADRRRRSVGRRPNACAAPTRTERHSGVSSTCSRSRAVSAAHTCARASSPSTSWLSFVTKKLSGSAAIWNPRSSSRLMMCFAALPVSRAGPCRRVSKAAAARVAPSGRSWSHCAEPRLRGRLVEVVLVVGPRRCPGSPRGSCRVRAWGRRRRVGPHR